MNLRMVHGLRGSWQVLAPLLVVVLLLAVLAVVSSDMQSAVRTRVVEQHEYANHRQQVAYLLMRYAATRDEADHRRFSDALAPALTGHHDPRRHAGWLWQPLRRLPLVAESAAIRAQADEELDALALLGTQLHRLLGQASVDDQRAQALVRQIGTASERLAELDRRLVATLAATARNADRAVAGVAALLAVLMVAAGALLSRRALQRRTRVEQALRRSEERLQRALDASGLTLWDFDVHSGEVFLSESWARALGEPAGETRTSFAALSARVPGSEREALMQSLIRSLKEPGVDYRVEHRVRRADGTSFWNLSEGRVVQRDSDGRALRMVGTNRDISDAKQAEAARNALQTQLRESQKMEAIGTLAGGIAHDFNNILGAILGNVALARGESADSAQSQLSLQQINKAALRARTLVQQILAYSRRQPHELRKRALAPLVHESVALLRSTLPASVSLQLQLSDEPLYVLADAAQLQQVLMNLCTNAWHALQGRPGRVQVGLQPATLDGSAHGAQLPPGRYVHLWVADDGCGMDEATRARVFEPFFTTKPVGQGTGLGLSVVQGIVAAHRGVITLRSAPGQGSSFDMHFPVLDEPATPAAQSAWAELDEPCDVARGRHVLVVDDDEVMLLLMQRLLQRLGYRVSCLQDAREAIECVRQRPHEFDMVISDFNMPHCSGLDVARAMAQVRADLPVVISSGHVTQDLQEQALRNGARGLVHKENTLEELGVVVQRVLQEA